MNVVDPAVFLKAACPAPGVSTHDTVHHRTASVFLNKTLALGTLVKHYRVIDHSFHLPVLLEASLSLVPPLLTLRTRKVIALFTCKLCLLLFILGGKLSVEDAIANFIGTKEEIGTLGNHGGNLELFVLFHTVYVDYPLEVQESWLGRAFVLRAF